MCGFRVYSALVTLRFGCAGGSMMERVSKGYAMLKECTPIRCLYAVLVCLLAWSKDLVKKQWPPDVCDADAVKAGWCSWLCSLRRAERGTTRVYNALTNYQMVFAHCTQSQSSDGYLIAVILCRAIS